MKSGKQLAVKVFLSIIASIIILAAGHSALKWEAEEYKTIGGYLPGYKERYVDDYPERSIGRIYASVRLLPKKDYTTTKQGPYSISILFQVPDAMNVDRIIVDNIKMLDGSGNVIFNDAPSYPEAVFDMQYGDRADSVYSKYSSFDFNSSYKWTVNDLGKSKVTVLIEATTYTDGTVQDTGTVTYKFIYHRETGVGPKNIV